MSANGVQDEDRLPTERVILKQVRAIVVPESIEPEWITNAIELLYPKAKRGEREQATVDAWVEVARNTAPSKRAAIRAHAGEPGTPDAKVGTFRAPPLRSWKDAEVYEAPPKPLVTARTVE